MKQRRFSGGYAIGLAGVLLAALVAQVAMAGGGQPNGATTVSKSQLRDLVEKEVAEQASAVSAKKRRAKRRPAGPAGPPGVQGPQGPQGPAGPALPLDPVHQVQPALPGFVCSTNPGTFCKTGAAGSPSPAWQNYGNGYTPVGYFKDAAGIVHLQGAAIVLPAGCSVTCGPIFYLPPGYRPSQIHESAIYGSSGGGEYLDIHPSGAVYPGPDPQFYAALGSISFRAD